MGIANSSAADGAEARGGDRCGTLGNADAYPPPLLPPVTADAADATKLEKTDEGVADSAGEETPVEMEAEGMADVDAGDEMDDAPSSSSSPMSSALSSLSSMSGTAYMRPMLLIK